MSNEKSNIFTAIGIGNLSYGALLAPRKAEKLLPKASGTDASLNRNPVNPKKLRCTMKEFFSYVDNPGIAEGCQIAPYMKMLVNRAFRKSWQEG